MNSKTANVRVDQPGTVAPKRDCLPCTACCDGWLSADIHEHKVSPGHPCPHSSPGGCTIYAERPHDPCRVFVCSWRVEQSPLPDWMRPDQSGAIVLLSLPWEGEVVISAVPVGEQIPAKTLEWLQAYARKHNRPMIFYQRLIENGQFTGLKQMGYGPAPFRQKVSELDQQADQQLTPMSASEKSSEPV